MSRFSSLFLFLSIPIVFAQARFIHAQTIAIGDAAKHVGEQATVCGLIASKHTADTLTGKPTFINFGQSFPTQTFTALIWDSDKAKVGDFPSTGNVCVTGTIISYKGVPEIVLYDSKSWAVNGTVPPTSPSYSIGPDDTLQITVWQEPTLSGTFPVRPDGMISMVLLGDIRAAGVTPIELADTLTQRLNKFLKDPLVSVMVMSPNSQKIYVMGEVGHVGPLELSNNMSPLQAIATAGGLTPYAKQKKIYILRGPAGKQQKIPFNYKNALRGLPNSSVALVAGDTIVVP
jgi:polysaccharide export outer membrane protein